MTAQPGLAQDAMELYTNTATVGVKGLTHDWQQKCQTDFNFFAFCGLEETTGCSKTVQNDLNSHMLPHGLRQSTWQRRPLWRLLATSAAMDF